jgi:hypothetical protein
VLAQRAFSLDFLGRAKNSRLASGRWRSHVEAYTTDQPGSVRRESNSRRPDDPAVVAALDMVRWELSLYIRDWSRLLN